MGIDRAQSALIIGLLLWLASSPAMAQQFPPGTPVAAAWEAFIKARNDEDNASALDRLDALGRLVELRFGHESPESVLVLGHRANLLQQLGRLAEAERDAQSALAMSERISGPSSPSTVDALNTLAVLYLADRGRGAAERQTFAAEAARLLEKALSETAVPQEQQRTMRNSLATAYGLLGRGEDAAALFRRMLADETQGHRSDDPLMRSLSLNLAQTLIGMGLLEDAEVVLEPLILSLRLDPTVPGPTLANALSAYASAATFPEQREAARREATGLYHLAGCIDPEAERLAILASSGEGYPWSSANPNCSGDLRLAREIAGLRGLAYLERVKFPGRSFAAVRLLSHAGDVVVGHTRATYSIDHETRLAFSRYRYVHREFVDSAWAAATGG